MKKRHQIKKMAEAGDVDSIFHLSFIYFNKKYASQKYKQALKWTIKAFEQRIAKSTYEAGRVYSGQELYWFTEAAEYNSEARTTLGLMYYNGEGFGQDYEKAFEWLSAAGGRKDIFMLGVMYYNGYGVKKNYKKAFKCFAQASEQNLVEAQFTLGIMFYLGQGVSQNYSKAAQWFKIAAEEGLISAQIILCLIYEQGQVEIKNPDYELVELYAWYLMAGINGVTIDEDNNSLCKRMNVEQIAEANYLVGRLFHSEHYNYIHDYDIDHKYITNNRIAFKYLTKAAEQGHINAQYELAKMYHNRESVQQDHKEAFKWYSKAAELGSDDAQCVLAKMYYIGEGVQQDHRESFKWYLKAAEQGNGDAQLNLAKMYRDGEGVVANYIEAFKWCLLAEKQGKNDIYCKNVLRGLMTPDQIAEAENQAKADNIDEMF